MYIVFQPNLFQASQTSSPDLSSDLEAAKAQAAELMSQLEQAKNANSDIQSKLDEININLSVTSTALNVAVAENATLSLNESPNVNE